MAQPTATPPAILLAAVFSHYPSALEWSRNRIESHWGAVCLTSPVFEHCETNYYSREMGQPLMKQFLAIDGLFDPANLSRMKLQSNEWERELAQSGQYSHARPVNIDPGYLMLNKLVLASCKDRAHRIYLSDGIYAEECLYYVAGWRSRPWTYPDYQREDFHAFFNLVRERLKELI